MATRAAVREPVFERGFKSWCENTAETLRRKLGKRTHEPLCPFELAKALQVEVWEFSAVQGLSQEAVRHLTSQTGDEWSARLLVTVLTYPHPSTKYQETVCTAGITEDGRWVRLYPLVRGVSVTQVRR